MLKYEKAGETHKSSSKNSNSSSSSNGFQNFWNDQIMERFIKANLFIICCVAAGLLLIVYLGAFSCEVSWILEAHGDLPFSSYILCTQFFVVFVATTILIHGLVTGLSWGLFAWAVIIGLFAIPELVFVMIMTTQHWGLQSVHGLTELISYLVRLIINCFALICVIPTGLRWRREAQVLSQLSNLATRLQLQTPPPSAPITQSDSRRSSKRLNAFENAGYQITEPTKIDMCLGAQSLDMYSNNQNEFNASVFPNYLQQQQLQLQLQHQYPDNGPIMTRNHNNSNNNNRAQSLMDLRCTLPGMYNPRYVLDMEDTNGKYFNITIDDLKNNLQDSNSKTPSIIGSVNDPIYCSIEPAQTTQYEQQKQKREQHQPQHKELQKEHQKEQQKPHHKQQQQQQHQSHKQTQRDKVPAKLTRNCISLENLDGINKVQNEMLAYGNNLLQNYTQQQYYLAMLSGYMHPLNNNMNIYRRPSMSQLNDGSFAGAILAQPLQRRSSQQLHHQTQQRQHQQQQQQQHNLQYYGGFGYANFTNPYITANSKLSLGNESDDYRKYRDVAL